VAQIAYSIGIASAGLAVAKGFFMAIPFLKSWNKWLISRAGNAEHSCAGAAFTPKH